MQSRTPLWSYPRIARLIADQFGVDYHQGHVWKILRTLNWSPQRPVGKARERNEEPSAPGSTRPGPVLKRGSSPKSVKLAKLLTLNELPSPAVDPLRATDPGGLPAGDGEEPSLPGRALPSRCPVSETGMWKTRDKFLYVNGLQKSFGFAPWRCTTNAS